MAVTVAPRRLASCTTAEPTPPDAPATSTCSPRAARARCNMFSAVPYAQGIEPSSTSLHLQSTANTSAAGTFTNSAKAPSKSEPIHTVSKEVNPDARMHARTSTRVPMRPMSTSGDTATTRPQQSVPWMIGNGVASLHPPSALATACRSSASAARAVSVVTLDEYQPSLVLISVLLTPAASTRSNTSPGASRGIGTSRYSNLSYPPLPVVTTAFIVDGCGAVLRGPVTVVSRSTRRCAGRRVRCALAGCGHRAPRCGQGCRPCPRLRRS